ncbi:hypothetical protein GTY79_08945, partial [Streptomyces sp. SID8385]|nr:hypothetical protein [Streptomyces sp. SID8385]
AGRLGGGGGGAGGPGGRRGAGGAAGAADGLRAGSGPKSLPVLKTVVVPSGVWHAPTHAP